MKNFIHLDRRFRDLTQDELNDLDILMSLGDTQFAPGITWADLLECPRVVLMAEAGSGKTKEMEQMAASFTTAGKVGFFIPIESIDRAKLIDTFSNADKTRFVTWKDDGQSMAWLFLDAVDELKLIQGKFERALQSVADAVDGHLDRIKVIVSCRPNDWQANFDLARFEKLLPIVDRDSEVAGYTSEEFFLRRLSVRQDRDQAKGVNPYKNKFRTVALLPLSDQQIDIFARGNNVQDVEAFVGELNRQNAWSFARRPLDLSDLVAVWRKARRLGTRKEQHVVNIAAKLKDKPEWAEHTILSDTKALEGAERLALALVLTRTRTIRSPDQEPSLNQTEGVLDAAQVLPDWSPSERNTLLRCALFDPATYGRIQLHHRSVQEFLAANRLLKLRESGMAIDALFRLIFADRYGFEVVIPSLRPIVGWLALFNDDVCREAGIREPETLLSHGDPESLTSEAKIDIVRRFAETYGKGHSRGINIPISQVRRLACPALDPLIRELWFKSPLNPDVSELLLELIWKSNSRGCADIAEVAAFDITLSPHHRVIAIRALVENGSLAAARRIADSMMSKTGNWPDQIIKGVAINLFPKIFAVPELIELIARTPYREYSVNGLDEQMESICRKISLPSTLAHELRDKLTDLIWNNRSPDLEIYRIVGKFDRFAPALAILCTRELQSGHVGLYGSVFRSSVIAHRFWHENSGDEEIFKDLISEANINPTMREAVFWWEIDLMKQLISSTDAKVIYFNGLFKGLISQLTQEDKPWLMTALADISNPGRRRVALEAMNGLWFESGLPESDRECVRQAVEGNEELLAELSRRFVWSEFVPVELKWKREERGLQVVIDGREQARLEKWQEWRLNLISDSELAFESPRVMETISCLFNWLTSKKNIGGRSQIWNHPLIERAFGEQVAVLAAKAFRSLWRSESPLLWSQKKPEERNNTPYSWIYALCGLAVESESAGWAHHLSPEEARLATVYATLELNRFAGWLVDLVDAHGSEVAEVLGAELEYEMTLSGKCQYLPTLQNAAHADLNIKKVLCPHCYKVFLKMSHAPNDAQEALWAGQHIEQLVCLLDETLIGVERDCIAAHCRARILEAPTGRLATDWLRALFRFDFGLGVDAMLAMLKRSDESAGIALFAAIFGNRSGVVFAAKDLPARARHLARLVKASYEVVPAEHDREHEGMFTPDVRDNAASARSFLGSALFSTKGQSTCLELLNLANDPLFAERSDRFRILARERAALDAEFEAFDVGMIRAIDKNLEAPAQGSDGLYALMMARLRDLAHDIKHHDFTDRRTLRTIHEEVEMQRTIAMRLESKARGAYSIVRENEQADLKKPDITLIDFIGKHRAVIEIKLADKPRSIADLEHALEHQILGQYLRHPLTKTGCMLLTYNGERKKWWHKPSKRYFDFDQLIDHLKLVATKLETQQADATRLTVFGLDLRDPLIRPAQR